MQQSVKTRQKKAITGITWSRQKLIHGYQYAWIL